MPDPFASLRRLADTSDLASLGPEAIGERAKAITDALETLPDVHADLRQARQDMGVLLHEKHGVSFRRFAAMLGRSPTRAKQIIEGERTSGKARPRVSESADTV